MVYTAAEEYEARSAALGITLRTGPTSLSEDCKIGQEEDADCDAVTDDKDLDADRDGLIELTSAAMLNNMRYMLNGTGYKTGADETLNTLGCPRNGCHGYELTQPIDMRAFPNWQPIGGDETSGHCGGDPFRATFDGNNHRISDLVIKRAAESCVGLFGITGAGAILKNIQLRAVSVRGNGRSGALVGFAQETQILNTSVMGPSQMIASGDYVGGLVGFGSALNITRSYATSNVSGMGDERGGLVGTLVRGIINTSSASGDILAAGNSIRVGGLVGAMWETRILHSTATGDIRGAHDYVGGLVGLAVDSEVRASAVNRSLIRGRNDAGGLVGHARRTIVAASNATHIDLRGDSGLGGLVGSVYNASIEHATATVNITVVGTGDDIGGLLGYGEFATLAAVAARATVAGKRNSIGGLVGFSYAGLINASVAAGEVMGDSSVGGLIGGGERTNIIGSGAEGRVNGSGDNVGGLVGGTHGVRIIASNATNPLIEGRDNVGGLVGTTLTTNIIGAQATSEVDGRDHVGGLVGYAGETIIEASYASGAVNGVGGFADGSIVGGLVGYAYLVNISASYASGTVSAKRANSSDPAPLSLVGGLVGYAYLVNISASYASGELEAGKFSNFGGLVGFGFDTNIRASYARARLAEVPENAFVGGLVGGARSERPVTAVNSFWDSTQIKNKDIREIGKPRSNLELGSTELSTKSLRFLWGGFFCPQDRTKRIWDFGGNQLYPAIACTPGGAAVQARNIFDIEGGQHIFGIIRPHFILETNDGTYSHRATNRRLNIYAALLTPGWMLSINNSLAVSMDNVTLSVQRRNRGGNFVEIFSTTLSEEFMLSRHLQKTGFYRLRISANSPKTFRVVIHYARNQDGDGLVDQEDLGRSASDILCLLLPNCDGDELDDGVDNCPTRANDDQLNTDGDRMGDVCDADDDGDGVVDNLDMGFDPSGETECRLLADCDADGKPDGADNCPRTTVSPLSDNDPDNDGCHNDEDLDNDGDGLIEIYDASGLDAVRYQLNGIGVGAVAEEAIDSTGCPAVEGCHGYELMADINLTDYSDDWQPIGGGGKLAGSKCQGDPFVALFDGNSRLISGLRIREMESCVGLFGSVGSGAELRNIRLTETNVTGVMRVGSLVGDGVEAQITNSSASGTVQGTSDVGGLVGKGEGITINRSSATGRVSGTGDRVGGLVGSGNQELNITASYATGNVIGRLSVGGLVGNGATSNIIRSYATGNVIGRLSVGGLVGLGATSSITASYATGRVNGTGNRVGGLVGSGNQELNITASYATGNVIGLTSVGGLVGNGNRTTIRASYAMGRVNASSQVGGLVGRAIELNIAASYATGNVAGSTFVGGLIGQPIDQRRIRSSYWDGQTTGISRSSTINLGEEKATAELQGTTSFEDIYMEWNDYRCPGSVGLVWDLGTAVHYPAITCTPGGLTAQRP